MLAPLTLEELRPRFGEAAGLSATEAIADTSAALASLSPVDSVSQWALWSGTNQTAARTELAIGTALGSLRGGGSKFQFTSVEGLIRHEMKLLVSPVGAPISYARPSPRYLSITIAVLITIRPMLVNACWLAKALKSSGVTMQPERTSAAITKIVMSTGYLDRPNIPKHHVQVLCLWHAGPRTSPNDCCSDISGNSACAAMQCDMTA